jgi:thiol-disulfide isomerase/thioredoxin
MQKKALIFLCSIMLSVTLMGQTVKKVKITDLEKYISQCDHPLIVNFWATYCLPCIKEIPYFQSTTAGYREKGVELILVSLDMPDFYPAKISSFAEKNKYTVPILWLDETNADYFCPKVDKHWSGGIPCSLFINNKTGFRQFYDRQLTDRQVVQAIRALVAVPAP